MKVPFSSAVAATAVAAALSAPSASMALNVSPDIIFGSGNANGSFTVKTVDFPNTSPAPVSVELGLRAKLRYDDAGAPQNIFNWDGDRTYTFAPTAGTPSNRSVFNFEWSVASLENGTFGQLNQGLAGVRLAYDIDPTAGVNFVEYDPLAFDAYYGTLTTANGGGTYVSNPGSTPPPPNATVAQNSVNYGFLAGAPLGPGSYDVRLSLLNNSGDERGFTEITINVVPVPAALPLLASVVGGIAWMKRRPKKTAKA